MELYIVDAVKNLGQDTLLLSLRPKDPSARLSFEPGQYAAVGFRRHGRRTPMRCFSIANAPNSDVLQFGVRLGGVFTRTIARLKPGDRAYVQGPFGEFVADPEYDKQIIMMAGGIGVTPFLSIIRAATEAHWQTKMTLLYSSRTQKDIPFFDELLELEKQNPYLRVIFYVTDKTITKTKTDRIAPGRIKGEHIDMLTSQRYEKFSYFICGPRTFMHGMKEILAARAVHPENVMTEEFGQASLLASVNGRRSISFLTYGWAAAAIVLGTFLVMAVDLYHAVPILSADESTTTPNKSSTAASSSKTIQPTTATTNNTSASSNASTSASNTATSGQSTAQPTTTYQQPTTNVS
jgi:ferredoxin-NADP reductase